MKKLDVCLEVVSFVLIMAIVMVALFSVENNEFPWYPLLAYVGLTGLTYIPRLHKFPVRVNPENRGMLYLYSSRTIRWIKVFLLLLDHVLPVFVVFAIILSSFYYWIEMVRENRMIIRRISQNHLSNLSK